MGLPSGGPLERLRLDPAAQDSGMCPNCEGHAGLPQFAGQLRPLTCRHRRSGNRQEDLVSAWFHQPGDEADAARRPARPTGHLTFEGLRDRMAESATFVNLDGGVGHPDAQRRYL